jgi:ligand-binding sensor domain-containing protein
MANARFDSTVRLCVVFAVATAFLIPTAAATGAQATPTTSAAAAPPTWTIYKPANTGIPGDYVYSVAIDANGQRWVTGEDPIWGEGGLARSSGKRWTGWTNVDGRAPTSRMRSLQFDAAGMPWMASDLGLLRLDHGKVRLAWSMANAPWPTNIVRDFDWDSQGNLWVALADLATVHGGLAKYDGIAWTVYTTANGLPWDAPWDRVEAVEIDAADNVYIGSDVLGGAKFDGTNWTWMKGGWVNDIEIADNGEPWFAFFSEGVKSWTGTKWIDRTGSFGTSGISLVTKDHDGNMWIATYTGSIWRFRHGVWDVEYNPPSLTGHIYGLVFDANDRPTASGIGGMDVLDADGSWRVYTSQNSSLANRWVDDIFVDSTGKVWFGTAGSGVIRFDGARWAGFNPYNWGTQPWPFPTDGAFGMAEDDVGRIWTTPTNNGVGAWDGASWQAHLDHLDLESLAFDAAGRLWASGYSGVFRFDGTSWASANPPASGEIGSLTIDQSGNVWVATTTGLERFDGTTWTVYTEANSGLPGNYVISLAPAPGGGVWVGTDKGLARLDRNSRWRVYTEADSGLPADVITALAVAPDGHLWVGAFDGQHFPYHGGVADFDGTTWNTYTTANSPLPHEQVEALAIDAQGRVWVAGASQGVALITPS